MTTNFLFDSLRMREGMEYRNLLVFGRQIFFDEAQLIGVEFVGLAGKGCGSIALCLDLGSMRLTA